MSAAVACFLDRMTNTVSSDVTRLLKQWSEGNHSALDALTPLVYDELRMRARNYLRRERPDHTLQPTALIHEAYLRMVGESLPEWQNRSHFFAIASRAMRQILVDHARRRGAGKRGSGVMDVTLNEALVPARADNCDLLALDEALTKLAAFDPRKCQVVEMRYFGGCTVEETAEALGVSTITVIRETRVAEAWLRRSMSGEPA
jgi:RNA polymerase sigma factor (TIGR02999 family)